MEAGEEAKGWILQRIIRLQVKVEMSVSKVRWGRIGARAILLGLGFLLGSTHMNAPSAAVPGVNVVDNSTDQTQHLMGHTLLPFEASTLSSQFGQDLEFRKITGRVPIFNGFFIEFGCADGITNSNSRFFERTYNWTGLCIEAHPINYKKAKQNRPGSNVLNVALGSAPGELEFWYLRDREGKLIQEQLSGIGEFFGETYLNIFKQEQSRGAILEKVKVPVVTLASLQYQYFRSGSVIDMLSMDCEGCEWEAMQGIDWSYNKFSFVTYELNSASKRFAKEMHETMFTNGYRQHRGTDNPIYLYSFDGH